MTKNLLLVFWLVFSAQSIFSQNLIPRDSAIRTGKLENGLTYFIRKNDKPKDKVELRLAIKAGSILEDEKQLGLAHFVEHMAFNGTASFKENELVAFLQSAGVEFGADLNAYTSFNETVYVLPLPKTSLSLIEKGFQVLYEWAGKIAFDPAEIDKERGIVIEEWRSGKGAEDRIFNKQIGVMLRGSRYAERLPIGSKESLESFKHDDLLRFYKTWYKPELMAVICVGDIDPVWAEKQIRSLFSKLPKSATPVKTPAYDVPGHAETLVSIETDPELTGTSLQLMIKHPKRPYHTEDGYRDQVKRTLFTQLLNTRLREKALEGNQPFLSAYASYSGGISSERDFYTLGVNAADTALLPSFAAMLEEVERVNRFGFSEAELARLKLKILRAYEKAYDERENARSPGLADELVTHFIEDEPVPGIAYEFAFLKKTLPSLTASEISKLAPLLMTKENRVITVAGPKKDGLVPVTKEELLATLDAVEKSTLTPWKEDVIATELLPKKPEKGRLMKKKDYPALQISEWKLSNGVTVVLKPTTFKNDQILMSATRPGGISLASDQNYLSASISSQFIRQSGVGAFSLTALDKFLAGRAVSVRPGIADYSENLGGQTSPRDLETMMQLIYLYGTTPRVDTAAFSNMMNNYREFVRNLSLDPEQQFFKKSGEILYNNHPRVRWISDISDLKRINPDSAAAFYRTRFADFSGFTFFFTGSFTLDQMQPLVETYLGGLPSLNRKDGWQDQNLDMISTKIDTTFRLGLEDKALVRMIWAGPMKFDVLSRYEVSSLGAVLDIVLINEIREKMRGVYGVSSNVALSKIPRQEFRAEITFPCAPENVDAITTKIREIVKDLAENGPKMQDLEKVRETQRQQIKSAIETNEFWHRSLADYYGNGFPPMLLLDWEKRTNGLSPAAIQKRAKVIFDPQSEKRFVLKPAEGK